MLVIAGLVSLGLWAAIWVALRSLALAWSLFRWRKILATSIIVLTTFATDRRKFDGFNPVAPGLITVGFGKEPVEMQVHTFDPSGKPVHDRFASPVSGTDRVPPFFYQVQAK
jgi:hypothetical protein